MHFDCKPAALAAAAVFMSATSGWAANITPDIIFGSGNVNGSFTVATGTYGDSTTFGPELPVVELGLRGKLRFNASNQAENTFNYDGTDTYTFAAGAAPSGFSWDTGSPTTPVWSFEWSIGSDSQYFGLPLAGGSSLNALTYQLRIDGAAGAGTNFAIFDPINVALADHALGTPLTANGGGVKATNPANYATLINNNSVAQNSWNYEFFNETTDGVYLSQLAGFDPADDGTYRIELEAFYNGQSIAMTGINIVVGNGAPAVPLPAGLPLLIGAFGGFALLRRRRG